MDKETKILVLKQNMCWDLQGAIINHKILKILDKFI